MGLHLHGPNGALERRARSRRSPVAFASDRRRLRVGLVNNMPDAALAVTERQFRTLVEAAAPERIVELHLFRMPGVARGPQARARLRARYRPLADIAEAGLDALIVTGAEPRAAELTEEPFWPSFRRLVDWADEAGLPTLWSCLAAHAAVLHLDGVARRPLARKCSGLFACSPTPDFGGDPLLAGLEAGWIAPHSRGNALDAAELAAAGYGVLTQAAGAGVDSFVRRSGAGRFLFLQGHLEYDANSLALEFKRDLQLYAERLRQEPPVLPQGVFDPAGEAQMRALVQAARQAPRPDLLQSWPAASTLALAPNTWRAPATLLVRNWLASSHIGVEAAAIRPPLPLSA